MLLLRSARTVAHMHEDVLAHAAQHATCYDIAAVAHDFLADKPEDWHDICRDFGRLVPPDGDTYFEFDLPPYANLSGTLRLNESGLRTAGVLLQCIGAGEGSIRDQLIGTLPFGPQRHASKKTTQLLAATILLELLADEPTVLPPVMKYYYLLGSDGLLVIAHIIQHFANVATTGDGDEALEIYLPYRSLQLPVFEAVRLLRTGASDKTTRKIEVTLIESSSPWARLLTLPYWELEPRRSA